MRGAAPLPGVDAAVRCVTQRTVQARIARSEAPTYNPSGFAPQAIVYVPTTRTWQNPSAQTPDPPSAAPCSACAAVACASAASSRSTRSASTSPRGDICGLIGPNGAGKTTLFNCLSRLYQYQRGDILFEGRVAQRAADATASPALGIGRTFQNLAMFRTMTVRDNVMVGAHARSSAGFVAERAAPAAVGAEERRLRERARRDHGATWAWPPFADRPSATCRSATQKRVELARALAAEPKLLLLDEPAAGLNHEELDGARRR